MKLEWVDYAVQALCGHPSEKMKSHEMKSREMESHEMESNEMQSHEMKSHEMKSNATPLISATVDCVLA